ncbi:hypothetical protein MBM_09173 [Drepanopeziza brunnea f. sp. 'multigermtubi' MB_m1]|uniref:Uncharacterized protein n=1 Tax=Marssonina brunnea f. sp. multigermtubi (strain MB_m1) TaxID=1072389 RepID=K1XJN5_MARBU|nr:uncharacterized protein MBM_09173 [Drepanopeziza brunnea f. sp. 'multigermtubi' MB_m1]EKD12604.1 hypothetical protein MBM_09173 [Drepanopeziza brunnea f. sp. 'multigermtubi' MB_m1]
MLPNDLGTQTTFDDTNEDTSDLGFDFDLLPYLRLENHTRARLIIEDFLDIKRYEQKREQAFASDLSDPDSSDGDLEGGNKRGNEWNGHGRRGRGHGGPTRGQGNETPRDLGRGYEPLGGPGLNRPFINTLFSTRVIARHTYGTPRALDDDDDFLELGTTDPHLRAKELALIFADQASRYGLTSDDYLAAFSIMLIKEAITFYYNYVIKARLPTFKANAIAVKDHFETDYRRSLRPGLKDDKSLADKLYSACKNVLKTTIARMNLASTFTAAVADIRRAIGFATEIIQPLKSESYRPAKASRAYASSSEPFAQHSSQHSFQHSS